MYQSFTMYVPWYIYIFNYFAKSQAPNLKRSNSNKGRGKLIPQIMDPSQMMKQEISPAKMNPELAMNFFGDELMPAPGPDMMSPPPPPPQMMPGQTMGPPLAPPVLSSPVNHPANTMLPPQPGKPPYNVQIKPRNKLPPSPLLDPLQNKKLVFNYTHNYMYLKNTA